MPSRPKTSEAKILEQYRVSFQNATTQPDIASALEQFGYDSHKIAEGEILLRKAVDAYLAKKARYDEKAEYHHKWLVLKMKLSGNYAKHRKLAKVIYRFDEVNKEKLGINDPIPRTYVKWLETVKKFYSVASSDNHIINALKRFNISEEHLTQNMQLIAELETARAQYMKKVGEAQNSTKVKNKTLADIRNWMYDFYAVARIALDERPQLLEALGIVVKS